MASPAPSPSRGRTSLTAHAEHSRLSVASPTRHTASVEAAPSQAATRSRPVPGLATVGPRRQVSSVGLRDDSAPTVRRKLDPEAVTFGDPVVLAEGDARQAFPEPAPAAAAAPRKKQPGYLGQAIVYFAENPARLAAKYVKGTQSWGEEERRRRLGLSFAVNGSLRFPNSVDTLTADPKPVVEAELKRVDTAGQGALDAVGKDVSTRVRGLLWGYTYRHTKDGKKAEFTESSLVDLIRAKRPPFDDYADGEEPKLVEALVALQGKKREHGVPYGFLRQYAATLGEPVHTRLQELGNDPVYVHSVDADAPSYETEKAAAAEAGEPAARVLEVYDRLIEEAQGANAGGRSPHLVIGGYNLTHPGKRAGEEADVHAADYRHTVRSNLVDRAIREAVHRVCPDMTYPTEPNFIVKGKTFYKKDPKPNAATGKLDKPGADWGTGSSEGTRLYETLLAYKHARSLHRKKEQAVNPAPDLKEALVQLEHRAAVPTGVEDNGDRLRIKASRTGANFPPSLLPAGTQKDDPIGYEDQYILQAQSRAGRTRLTTAYLSALTVQKTRRQHGQDVAQHKTDTARAAYWDPIDAEFDRLHPAVPDEPKAVTDARAKQRLENRKPHRAGLRDHLRDHGAVEPPPIKNVAVDKSVVSGRFAPVEAMVRDLVSLGAPKDYAAYGIVAVEQPWELVKIEPILVAIHDGLTRVKLPRLDEIPVPAAL